MMATERAAAALAKLQSGAWLEAEVQARAALALEPDDPFASLLLGLAIGAMGEADRAAAVLEHAAGLRPDARHPCQDLADMQPPLPPTLIRRQFRACPPGTLDCGSPSPNFCWTTTGCRRPRRYWRKL
jgi:hypothetical protein